MRALLLLLPFLFASCAYEGVIVKKNTRPHPFYESVGVEEMNSIELRDSAGMVHRQMVTPDVYARYEHGQYFNDLQPPPADADKNVDVEPTLVPMRPVKPIANGSGRGTGHAVASNHRATTRIATASGTKKAAITAHPGSAARRSVAAKSAKKQPTAQTIAVSQARISNPAIARTTPIQIPNATRATAPSAPKPVGSTSMAHFSAEISGQGVKPVAGNPTTGAAHNPIRKTSTAQHPSKKSGAKAKTAHKSSTAKPMLKPPSVETRTENDSSPE